MSQQVKPGDLAVIVGGSKKNLGRIVRVLSILPPTPVGGTIGHYRSTNGRWITVRQRKEGTDVEIEALGTPLFAGPTLRVVVRPFLLRLLRPLRDTDGEDEILRIAGRPAPTDVKGFEDTTWMPLEGEQE